MSDQADRFNAGKVDLSLLPIKACVEEALVWQAGMKKYGRDNWRKLWGDDTTNVVMASLLRHAFAIMDGQVYDPETGLQHAAHIRCNAAMLIEHQHKKMIDKIENDKKEIDKFLEENADLRDELVEDN
jgi:hypothetical protein